MKTKKKLFSFLLALATVLALITVPAKKVEAGSAPAKVRNVLCYNWKPKTANPTFVWAGVADGYQVVVYSLGGKKLKTYTTAARSYTVNINSIKNAGCKIRVRGYNNVGKSKKFGAWSDTKVFVPQCDATIRRYYGARNDAVINWTPVKNAVGYRIYVATKNSSGSYSYKMYKKAGKQITSMSVPKGLGYIVVSPDVKVKGKTYKCVMKNYYSFWYLNDSY